MVKINHVFRMSPLTSSALKAIVLLHLFLLPHLSSAQWSQTLGWGGAGYGKRSMEPFTTETKILSQFKSVTSCSVNPVFQKIMSELIQKVVNSWYVYCAGMTILPHMLPYCQPSANSVDPDQTSELFRINKCREEQNKQKHSMDPLYGYDAE